MKKKLILFVVILFVVSIDLFSQTSNTVKNYKFCELVGISNFLGTKVKVSIDFGQKRSFLESNILLDENGNPVKFNSMIDAMNSMSAKGWEFVQAYVVTEGSSGTSSSVCHYVLKKEVTIEELKSINSAEETK